MALTEEQDALQAIQLGDPCIVMLTTEIDKEVTSYWRSKWEEYLDGMDPKKWSPLAVEHNEEPLGQRKPPASQSVTFSDVPV